MDFIETVISRYHFKKTANLLEDWIKKTFPIPSKEKAIKILNKRVKSEKDIEEVYNAIPKMITYLKNMKFSSDYQTPSKRIFPEGFVNNLIILIAIFSVLGHLYSKEHAYDKLKKKNIIFEEKEMPSNLKQDELLGKLPMSEEIIKKLKNYSSIENMNKSLMKIMEDKKLKEITNLDLPNLLKIKYPLQLKMSLDKKGRVPLYPSQIKDLKEGDIIYVHKKYDVEEYKQLEKRVENM